MTRSARVMMKRDDNGIVIPKSGNSTAFRGEYDASNNLIYAGFARPGSAEGSNVWQLMKLTYDASNNITKIEWPELNGSATSDFDFNYTGRAGYTYS